MRIGNVKCVIRKWNFKPRILTLRHAAHSILIWGQGMTTQPLEEAPPRAERRDCPRKKLRVSIEIEWGAAVLTGTVRDIGVTGLFVELTPPLWIGAAFRARLIVNPVVVLDCTVVRVEPNAGMAVRYEVPEDGGKAQLEKLLVSLAPA